MNALSLQIRWAITRAQAEATIARLRDFDPNQPRDETGKWTDTGAGDGGGGETAPAAPGKPDPAVVNVGGDEWNQRTAERLEREYQAARPKVEKLAQESVGKTSTVSAVSEEVEEPEEEEEPPFIPEEWDQLSNSAQSDAEEQFISKNTDAYYDSEVENWSSEYAPGEAKAQVADDFNNGQNNQWAMDALNEMRMEREENGEPPIPYSNEQLLASMQIIYDKDKYKAKPVLGFDDDKLQEPSNLPPPEQGTLPGIEAADPSKQLKEEMRENIESYVLEAFDKEADNVMDKMEPPEYLKDSANEMAGESWSSMGDDEKFEWVKNYTSIVEDESTAGSGEKPSKQIAGSLLTTVEALPGTYDPLQEGHGGSIAYDRTQKLARWLSVARTREVLAERKIPALMDDAILAGADSRLWRAWKESSTANDAMILQVATADELGGRLNAKTRATIDRDNMIVLANEKYSAIGGYAGVKAYVRAKWEVTQYLLDKAGVKELKLYRGIELEPEIVTKIFAVRAMESARVIGGQTYLPTLAVKRNGAASTSIDAGVSNGWGRDDNRIVLRAVVPRTAAISVPAYGINVHGEKEVVVAGTAWKSWDAWKGKAPLFEDVPPMAPA